MQHMVLLVPSISVPNDICQHIEAWTKRSTLVARFMGPTWGPSGADRTWTLLSENTFKCTKNFFFTFSSFYPKGPIDNRLSITGSGNGLAMIGNSLCYNLWTHIMGAWGWGQSRITLEWLSKFFSSNSIFFKSSSLKSQMLFVSAN